MIIIILLVVLGMFLAKEYPKLRKGITYAALGLAVITVLHIGFNLTTSKSTVSLQSENVVVGDMNNHHHEKQQYIP